MKFISYFKRFKQFIGFIVLVGMFIYIFLSLTYLFRQNPFGYNDRISVAGFPEEKSDSIDVVYIGGSAAFVYWEPYRAYSDCGFTSYDLATNTLQAESIIAYLEFSEKYQNPDLYIIGLRSFQYYSEDGDEIGLRLTSDSLDEGLIKFKLINRYMDNRILDADKVALYVSLIKYHTNYVALGNQTAWEMIDNRIPCPYKGCQIQGAWAEIQQPINFVSEDRANIVPGAEKTPPLPAGGPAAGAGQPQQKEDIPSLPPQPAASGEVRNDAAPENAPQPSAGVRQAARTEGADGPLPPPGRTEGPSSQEPPKAGNDREREKTSGESAAAPDGDILYLPFYADHEPPALEYIHRTVQKSMFEKKLEGEYTVLLIGDSFMEEATLTLMRDSYYKRSGLNFQSIARFSTGLTSTRKWNWQQKLEEGILKYHPDIVLILLGANDLTGIVEEKKVYPYMSERWMQKYGERAEALIDTALRHNVVPIWIGLPVMVHEPFLTGIPLISRMQKQACINKNIIYIDTLKTLADENGGFVTFKKDENGKSIRLRKKDRCHIAADGIRLVMDEVIPFIRRYVEYKEMLCHADNSEKTSAH